MNNKGFTLIELIVTISIISLLTVIMVPVVQKTSERVKYQSYKNLENLIMQATIDYLYHSAEDGYSIDSIKGDTDNCSEEKSCYGVYTVGEILDKNIYYTNEKDIEGKLTVINPTNGKSMRNRTFIIYYDTGTFSLKGEFSEGIDDSKYESEIE